MQTCMELITVSYIKMLLLGIYIFLQLTHEATKAMVPNTTLAAEDAIMTASIAFETSSEYCFHLSHRGKQTPLLAKNASLQFIVENSLL